MNSVDRTELGQSNAKQYTNRFNLAKICSIILYALCGFIFAKTQFFKTCAPLGTAFAAAAPKNGYFFSLVGIMLGTVLPLQSGNALRYLAAVTAVSGVRWAIGGLISSKGRYIFAPILCFIALCGTGLAITLYVGDIEDTFIVISESVLGAGATYIMQQVTDVVNGITKGRIKIALPTIDDITTEAKRDKCINHTQMIACICFILLLVSGASSIQYLGFSPVRVISVAVVMAAAYLYGEGIGALCGTAAGIAMGLNGEMSAFFAAAYAFGGFAAGMFSKAGKIFIAVGYLSSCLITGMVIGDMQIMMIGLYEAIIGWLIFLLIPSRFADRVRYKAEIEQPKPTQAAFRKTVKMQLNNAALALNEVSGAVQRASKMSEKAQLEKGLADTVREKLCEQCEYKSKCEDESGREMRAMFAEAEKQIKQSGQLDIKTIPMRMLKRCKHPYELTALFNGIFDERLYRTSCDRKLNEIRLLMSEQLEGMSYLLANIGDEVEQKQEIDLKLNDEIQYELEKIGVKIDDVCCIYDNSNRLSVAVAAINNEKNACDEEDICEKISKTANVKMTITQKHITKNGILLNLKQASRYKINTGIAQHSFKDGKLCGDSFKKFYNKEGKFVSIISDGMGTGSNAALDGELVSGIISRLISSGFDYDSVLKMVNCAMMVKSNDESLSTVDICEIEPDTGSLICMKAGAPPSLLLHNGKVERIDCACLPVGILCDIAFEKSSLRLEEGDILLMLSDGALGGGIKWIEQELLCFCGDNMQVLADRIVKQAQSQRQDGRDDDITVMVMTLCAA